MHPPIYSATFNALSRLSLPIDHSNSFHTLSPIDQPIHLQRIPPLPITPTQQHPLQITSIRTLRPVTLSINPLHSPLSVNLSPIHPLHPLATLSSYQVTLIALPSRLTPLPRPSHNPSHHPFAHLPTLCNNLYPHALPCLIILPPPHQHSSILSSPLSSTNYRLPSTPSYQIS